MTQLLRKFQTLIKKLEGIREHVEKQHQEMLANTLESIPGKGLARDPDMRLHIIQQIGKLQKMVLASSDEDFEKLETQQEQQEINDASEFVIPDATAQYQQDKKELLQQNVNEDHFGVYPWESSKWSNYQPIEEPPPVPAVRAGMLEVGGVKEPMKTLMCLDVIGHKNVMIKASGDSIAVAVEALQNILLRLLVVFPPMRLRLLMIDPVGVGTNFAGFMHLPEEAVSGKIWSDTQHIEEKLGELCEHMENIIQKYLLNQYRSMEEYNEEAGEVAEPYRLVVIANFPTNFTLHAARRLLSLARNGPKSGIYVLIHIDPTRKISYDFSLEELEQVCDVFEGQEEKTVFAYNDKEFSVSFDSPPQQFQEIVKKIGAAYRGANRITVPYEKFIEHQYPKWWQRDTRDCVQIPIGKSGRDEMYFAIGKGLTHHALMVGKTGSGKSTLLNILILGAAIAYSPQEIQLYLIDFKEGVEFKKYADPVLPHAKVIAIQSEREFGISVLKGLDQELTYRGDELFRPNKVKNITEYRNKQGKVLPRILLVVDEFQEFFTEDDQLAMQARTILERLVRKGRSVGIHIVLSSQSLTGSGSLPLAVTNQIAIRIALQCSDGDSRLILGDENPAAKHLSRPGEGIYNDANGLIEGNRVFQTFWLEDTIMEQYLQKIHEKAPHRYDTILFEGDALGNIQKNVALQKIVAATDHENLKMWFGQPIAMQEEHTHVVLRQQTGANALFLGQNEDCIMGTFLGAMVSILLQSYRSKSKIYVVNLGTVDAPWQEHLGTILDSYPLPQQLTIEKNRRSVVEIVEEIHRATDLRLQQETIQQNVEKIFLFFVGLHRARDLYAPDSWSPPEATKKFTSILEEGPDVGVHSFIQCDTRANMNKILSQSLKEFDIRIVSQMNAVDSSSILDSILASRLDANRALLYNEEHSSYMEKFCPYEFPDKKWTQMLFNELGKDNDI